MNIENVSERFMALSGKAVSEMGRWHPLIEDACRFVEAHATVTDPNEEQTARLELLAAVYAFRMMSVCDSDRLTSFTAGDVKFTSPADAAGKAEALWQQLCKDNADIWNSERFIFGRIETA